MGMDELCYPGWSGQGALGCAGAPQEQHPGRDQALMGPVASQDEGLVRLGEAGAREAPEADGEEEHGAGVAAAAAGEAAGGGEAGGEDGG